MNVIAAPTPANEDELTALVRAAFASRQALHTEGRGTKRHHGPAVAAHAQRISMARLDRITSYEPGDMVVSVQAGVRLQDLQRTLAERGQWLPVDPPYADATIGGVLATASSGPRRLGYGTARDLVLGMRVVGPAGVVTKSGGRVVKNVTGYDLHKLQVGAFGSLGVLLEIHFKVSPRPEMSGAVVFPCPTLADAHALLRGVASSALRPVALDALDAGAATALRALEPELPNGPALAVVGIDGSRPVWDRHLRELRALRSEHSVLESAERLWLAFRDTPARRAAEVTVRIGARPNDLGTLLAALSPADATAIQCHVATGVARVSLPATDGPTLASRLASWTTRAVSGQGYVVVESAPPGLSGRDKLPWGGSTSTLARRIKQAWDPNQLLNPGRMAL